MQSSIAALAEKSRDGGDESVSGRLENDRCGRPLPERGIDPPGMEDERDAAVEELQQISVLSALPRSKSNTPAERSG